MAAHEEVLGERVDGLGADAVQADGELENFVVVLGAGVDLGDAVHDFAEGNAPSIIAHGDDVALNADLDLLARTHDEFIDGIVDDLLEEDVAAVIVVGAIPEAPDVHAGAQPDVFEGGEGLDFALVVIVLRFFSHTSCRKDIEGGRMDAKKEMRFPQIAGAKRNDLSLAPLSGNDAHE